MAFGYIGVEPTNDNTANNGVFSLKDINKITKDFNNSSETFTCTYVLVGGGGPGVNTYAGGGGGAGGVISCYNNQGGLGTLDTGVTISIGKLYPVIVGAGGTGQVGGTTQFHTLKAIGGGRGWGSGNRSDDGASGGGGGRAFNYENRGRSFPRALSDAQRLILFGSTARQGFEGSQTSYENYNFSGPGGGAGAGGAGNQTAGQAGVYCNILTTAQATTVGVGENSGANVYFASGGSAGNVADGTAIGAAVGGGGNGGSTSVAGQTGATNTGGGGGGSGTVGTYSTGGSGVVILRYPDTVTITVGAGLTWYGSELSTGAGESIAVIKSGSGDVSWSKA